MILLQYLIVVEEDIIEEVSGSQYLNLMALFGNLQNNIVGKEVRNVPLPTFFLQ